MDDRSRPGPEPPLPRVSDLRASFVSAEVEQAFRHETRRTWRNQVRLSLAVGVVAYLVFGGLDYQALGPGPEFSAVATARLVAIAAAMAAFVATFLVKDHRTLDLVVMITTLIYGLAYGYVAPWRPDHSVFHAVSFVVIIFGVLLFVPNRISFCLATGVVTTACYMAVYALFLSSGSNDAFSIGLLLVTCCILGFASAHHIHRAWRKGYANLVALKDSNGRLHAQQRKLEELTEDLTLARDAADQANSAKSEFLANMSHELRTPLNAVIGFSEVIMEEALGPIGNTRYRGCASDIHVSGRHLLALINDILDLSKVEAGKQELQEAVVDLPRLVGESTTLVKKNAEQAGIRLRSHVAPDLPPIIADQVKVKQALVNLLSNAVKFTPAGGTVTVEAGRDAGGGLAIAVHDTGIGIAAEDLPKVLEPFHQVANSLTRQHQGTGLGLPLSKALIEMHGGTLALESEPSVGTIATIRLPADRLRDRAA